MDYILGKKAEGCIFCLFPAEEHDAQNLILGRTRHSFVMLNRFPYNNGHLMVIPRHHCCDLRKLDDEQLLDLHRLLSTSIDVLARAANPEGLNIGMNLGKVAGAGIDEHLHYHLVPRWNGDTNFMPVLAETRVMVEHLDAAWQRLRPLFDEALGG
jgi:ATP adenylyltransferase